MKISLKVWRFDGTIDKYISIKTKRIIAKVKADNFLKAYLKVSYRTGGFNDGIYITKKDLLFALKAFLEE